LLAQEANVHHEWRRRIQAARETSTLYSTLFDRGWSDAPHRTLRNSTVEAWERAGRPAAPDGPARATSSLTRQTAAASTATTPAPRWGGTTGDVEALALYAGQSAGIVNDVLPAAAIVEELISAAAQTLTNSGLQR